MQFTEFKDKHLTSFENYLLQHIQEKSHTALEKSMRYSLDAKGKRLRPLLLLAVLDAFEVDVLLGYPVASALEMIHTYSLIHDDLPAMDDDQLRRGKATNHIQFDEATAILAGDALLTLAFEVVTEGDLSVDIKLKLSRMLAKAAGYQGMVGGQQADIEGEKKERSLTEIEAIHERKTGALIKMAVLSAGIISKKEQAILNELEKFAENLGIAYQIRDDLLDLLASEEELGKGVMTDKALGKSTYPSLLGVDGSFKALDERLKTAKNALTEISLQDDQFKTDVLINFVNLLNLEEYK